MITTDLDDEDDATTGTSSEGESMTLREIYTHLLLEDEMILTIASEDYEQLKAGLTNVKAKENNKLRNKGMPVDSTKLTFTVLPCESEGDTRVQIQLKQKRAFTIKKIESPEGF